MTGPAIIQREGVTIYDTTALSELLTARVDRLLACEDQATLGAALFDLAVFRDEVRAAFAQVEQHCAMIAGSKQFDVGGLGTFTVRKRKDRKTWDKERLLADVLDSRLVDEETGEVADETPLDRVTSVWNLGTPRLSALRARGLNPDHYCQSEEMGWAVQLPSRGGEEED